MDNHIKRPELQKLLGHLDGAISELLRRRNNIPDANLLVKKTREAGKIFELSKILNNENGTSPALLYLRMLRRRNKVKKNTRQKC